MSSPLCAAAQLARHFPTPTPFLTLSPLGISPHPYLLPAFPNDSPPTRPTNQSPFLPHQITLPPLTPFPPCSIPFLVPTCPFAPASQRPQHSSACPSQASPCLSVLSHARPSFLTPAPRLRAPHSPCFLTSLSFFRPENVQIDGTGQVGRCGKGVRSRRGQRHPAKPQVAEIAWRQAEQKPSPNRPVPLIWAFCRRFSDNMKPKRAETTHKHSLNPKPRCFLSPGSALDDSILVRIPRIIPTDF